VAYLSRDGAGAAKLVARYHASVDDRRFGDETLIELPAGTYDWRMYASDMTMPADDPRFPDSWTENARAIRLSSAIRDPSAARGSSVRTRSRSSTGTCW
jgi:hypothetical protein